MPARIDYNTVLVALSVAIAVTASFAALLLARHFRRPVRHGGWLKAGAAVLMGAAVYGMHYTGMVAARFYPAPAGVTDASDVIATDGLAWAIAAGAIVVISLALLAGLADRRLVAARARTEAIVEAALDCIVTIDEQGRVLEFNRAAERTLGYTRAQAVGRELADLIIPERFRAAHRAGLEHFGKTGDGPILGRRLELSAMTADGREIDVELAITRIPVGDPSVFTGFLRDITERKRAQEAHARLAAIVESSDDAIIGKTLDGVITAWNRGAEAMYGYTAAEAVGQHISLIIPPERLAEEDEVLARLRRGEKVDHFETERQAKDGRRLSISLTVSPIKDTEGRVIGASKVARDITERRLAQEVLRRAKADAEEAQRVAEAANRAKSEFLAAMSHELRTPLNAIAGYAQLMLEGISGPVSEKQRDYLNRVRQNQRVLLSLINDVLNFAKLEAGRLEIKMEPVAVAEILASLEPLVAPQLQAKGLTYERGSFDTDVFALGDYERVRQILINLLTNAIKFTPAGGRITSGAAACDSGVQIWVRDTGRGISADKLESIFEPFVQVDRQKTSSEESQGIGLGLAISRDLARAMNGDLTAESTMGKGSTFTLSLRRARGKDEAADHLTGFDGRDEHIAAREAAL
jgi:PAS domain S-box-containing protein